MSIVSRRMVGKPIGFMMRKTIWDWDVNNIQIFVREFRRSSGPESLRSYASKKQRITSQGEPIADQSTTKRRRKTWTRVWIAAKNEAHSREFGKRANKREICRYSLCPTVYDNRMSTQRCLYSVYRGEHQWKFASSRPIHWNSAVVKQCAISFTTDACARFDARKSRTPIIKRFLIKFRFNWCPREMTIGGRWLAHNIFRHI